MRFKQGYDRIDLLSCISGKFGTVALLVGLLNGDTFTDTSCFFHF